MEINQIHNNELRAQMGNCALDILLKEDFVKREEVKNPRMSVGYMFTTEEGALEALFKVQCDEKVFAFAAQKGAVLLLNISEEQYNETVDYMVGYHDCLKDDKPGT